MATYNAAQQTDGNPWKGLNFYLEGETLYGRDTEIQSLAQYITNNTQTVLYGKSGIGKSSLVNAGIFPVARREGLYPIPIRLKHDLADSYISQVRLAFQESGIGMTEMVPVIDESQETLWEFFHRHSFYHPERGILIRPLVVFDQFEEIFTLQHDEGKKKAFFSELADLLNEVTPQYILDANDNTPSMEEAPVSHGEKGFVLDFGSASEDSIRAYQETSLFNLVFTIREDFLSYLERYTAYIPVMKTNRYALLPINEEQAADIIMKPCPGLISADVATLIIQKVTGHTDFQLDGIPEIEVDSAVLSLYLSRLYVKKGDATTITAELVRQFSDDIIKDFYEESVVDLPLHDVEEIEDQLLTYDGRRNNVSRNDLIREGVSASVIKTLVEDRKLLRQFSYQDDIRVEFMHDILCPVVDDRINQRELARQQEEERQRQEAETQERLRKMQEEANLMRRRNRKRLTAIGVTFFMLAIAFVLTWWLLYRPYCEYYASFTTATGWPEGLGEQLHGKERSEFVFHYRLTRRGRLPSMNFMGLHINHHFYKVEVLNSQGAPTTNKMMESPLVALSETTNKDEISRTFACLQLRTTKWLFSSDADGNIARQTSYDADGNILYSIQYYRTSDTSGDSPTQILWMNYIDAEGKPLRVRDNGADRIRITVHDGLFVRKQFFNEVGAPQRNGRMAYGYTYKYDPVNGNILAITPLDEFGEGVASRSLKFTNFDSYCRWTEANNAQAQYGPDYIIYLMPDRTDSLRFNADGQQVYRSELIHGETFRTFRYENGRIAEESTYSILNNGALHLTGRVRNVYTPDTQELTECTTFNEKSNPCYLSEIRQHRGPSYIVSYYAGMRPDALRPVNHPEDGYHEQISEVYRQDSLTEKRFTYNVIDSISGKKHILRQERKFYNSDSILARHIATDSNGKRVISLEYEIENGIVVGQHVIGLSGNAIRCPQWDDLGLCYYRIKFVRDFLGHIVSLKAFNEFDEISVATFDNWEYKVSMVSGDELIREGIKDGPFGREQHETHGLGIFKLSLIPLNGCQEVEYLHITDINGTYYRCGLHDGDIIVKREGRKVLAARPTHDLTSDSGERIYFEIRWYTPDEGNKGAETYPVYYTSEESKKLNDAITYYESK